MLTSPRKKALRPALAEAAALGIALTSSACGGDRVTPDNSAVDTDGSEAAEETAAQADGAEGMTKL